MKKILIYFLSFIILLIAVAAGVGYAISAPGFDGETRAHFNGTRFENPSGREASGFGDVLKWMFSRDQEPWTEITDPAEPQLPEAQVDSSLHITYINHATFLVQTANSNILTDPIFSERASPFQWAGPKRMRPPGIKLDQVPEVDMVFISHNHYDHLDEASVKSIYERDKPLFIVPLGVGKFLNSIGITNHVELDWWEDHQWKNLNIQSVPAQHFSGRGMFDRDKTLWAGYMLETPGHRIYFAGDTGYSEAMFREIGERAGNPDVALLPIGAYRPRWFMSPIHVSPAEALKIHFDVKAGQSIAMHYGTFPLADEGQFTPVKELDSVLVQQGLNDSEFIILPEGQRYIKN